MPPLEPESTGTSEATNAGFLNQRMGELIDAGRSGSAAVIAALGSIATAIANSLIGGSTGATDNRLLRSKGTSGHTLDASVVTCDDSGNISTFATLTPNTGGAFQTSTSNGNTALLRAYDVDGAAYTTFATLTAGNNPTFDLAAGTTKGSAAIAVVTQVFFWSWYFPNATAKDYKMIVNSPIACTINSVTTICESGTTTLNGKINTTALGGTANAVSTSEQTQTHTTSNSLAVGDDFQLTPSSISSLVGMTVTVKITVTLAAS